MIIVAAFYRFARIPDPAERCRDLRSRLDRLGVSGTVLIAPEGVNGTLAGSRAAIDAAQAALRALPGCGDLTARESTAQLQPFGRLKVRLKREIVTMGQPSVDPTAAVGRYVSPAAWNALIDAPDVSVIDTRNAYEVAIGSFDGAIDPHTDRFGDFPGWWSRNCAALHGKRIAMFCTGGIRCEKATNYLIGRGVDEVFHLRGGILGYLEQVPEAQSRWRGDCFVFDRRVSVRHGLREGAHTLCHGCRRPLAPADLARPAYEPGVACHQCDALTGDADKARFRERQRQINRVVTTTR